MSGLFKEKMTALGATCAALARGLLASKTQTYVIGACLKTSVKASSYGFALAQGFRGKVDSAQEIG
jgi:hypothetical protein